MKRMILSLLLSLSVVAASAFRIEYGRNIIISEPVYEDLYIAGGNITINAPVYGDLVIAGGTIIINDSIANDLLVVGGSITFNGFVGDDIRCAGGNLVITKNVRGDVVVAGGRISIAKGVSIGGLLSGGGNIEIEGIINGNLRGTFGDLLLKGSVMGQVNCKAGSITIDGPIGGPSTLSASYILLESKAAFNNDVRYWSEQNTLDFSPYMVKGKAIYDPSLRIRSSKWYYLGFTELLVLFWYLGMALVTILILQYLFSNSFSKSANTAFDKPLKSIAIGLLFVIVVPVAAVLSFVTMIGVPVGIFLGLSYVGVLLLSTTIISLVAANWANNRLSKKWNNWQIAFMAFGLFILFKLIFLTPFVGWVIMILFGCLSFGSILLNVRWRRNNKLKASPGLNVE